MSIEITPQKVGTELAPNAERLCYATPEVPFHFSVGVVAVSSLCAEEARVATLYSPPEFDNPFGITNFDQLIRETPENGESFEATVRRGLLEEIGATQSRVVAPLPGYAGIFQGTHQQYHKTTMYFLAEVPLDGVDSALRDRQEAEASLRVVWRSLPDAISRQKDQRRHMLRAGRPDLVELDQLETTWELLKNPKKLATR